MFALKYYHVQYVLMAYDHISGDASLPLQLHDAAFCGVSL